ncbi:uncharacterized protein SPPG_00887 [Spizellomyces punctatus DAOM BR117]|uniref:Uncharacterized protein n=1 Tax=Spizellomyces punctatus (strain DAOM BR117) TaxID=645134 RepID=A0A0L0HR92_SPIPD|nr:uncharacterized protein SPPG_00887 [Spizellomyces punctatus DAOM BR117]KND03399.1 hypothetical protein SPPG_00887 [Spizellomyces punctatus DAOM BR117]|eukprot:XP_016611438.1 hypothetical protein SPPG_00887 [Spizellomyces punctatus DAOM BR117]
MRKPMRITEPTGQQDCYGRWDARRSSLYLVRLFPSRSSSTFDKPTSAVLLNGLCAGRILLTWTVYTVSIQLDSPAVTGPTKGTAVGAGNKVDGGSRQGVNLAPIIFGVAVGLVVIGAGAGFLMYRRRKRANISPFRERKVGTINKGDSTGPDGNGGDMERGYRAQTEYTNTAGGVLAMPNAEMQMTELDSRMRLPNGGAGLPPPVGPVSDRSMLVAGAGPVAAVRADIPQGSQQGSLERTVLATGNTTVPPIQAFDPPKPINQSQPNAPQRAAPFPLSVDQMGSLERAVLTAASSVAEPLAENPTAPARPALVNSANVITANMAIIPSIPLSVLSSGKKSDTYTLPPQLRQENFEEFERSNVVQNQQKSRDKRPDSGLGGSLERSSILGLVPDVMPTPPPRAQSVRPGTTEPKNAQSSVIPDFGQQQQQQKQVGPMSKNPATNAPRTTTTVSQRSEKSETQKADKPVTAPAAEPNIQKRGPVPILQAPPRKVKKNGQNSASQQPQNPTLTTTPFTPPQGPPPTEELPIPASANVPLSSLDRSLPPHSLPPTASRPPAFEIPPPTRPAPTQPPSQQTSANSNPRKSTAGTLQNGQPKTIKIDDQIMKDASSRVVSVRVSSLPETRIREDEKMLMGRLLKQGEATMTEQSQSSGMPTVPTPSQKDVSTPGSGRTDDAKPVHNPQAALEALLKIELPKRVERRLSSPARKTNKGSVSKVDEPDARAPQDQLGPPGRSDTLTNAPQRDVSALPKSSDPSTSQPTVKPETMQRAIDRFRDIARASAELKNPVPMQRAVDRFKEVQGTLERKRERANQKEATQVTEPVEDNSSNVPVNPSKPLLPSLVPRSDSTSMGSVRPTERSVQISSTLPPAVKAVSGGSLDRPVGGPTPSSVRTVLGPPPSTVPVPPTRNAVPLPPPIRGEPSLERASSVRTIGPSMGSLPALGDVMPPPLARTEGPPASSVRSFPPPPPVAPGPQRVKSELPPPIGSLPPSMGSDLPPPVERNLEPTGPMVRSLQSESSMRTVLPPPIARAPPSTSDLLPPVRATGAMQRALPPPTADLPPPPPSIRPTRPMEGGPADVPPAVQATGSFYKASPPSPNSPPRSASPPQPRASTIVPAAPLRSTLKRSDQKSKVTKSVRFEIPAPNRDSRPISVRQSSLINAQRMRAAFTTNDPRGQRVSSLANQRGPVLNAYAIGRQAAVPRQLGAGRDSVRGSGMVEYDGGANRDSLRTRSVNLSAPPAWIKMRRESNMPSPMLAGPEDTQSLVKEAPKARLAQPEPVRPPTPVKKDESEPQRGPATPVPTFSPEPPSVPSDEMENVSSPIVQVLPPLGRITSTEPSPNVQSKDAFTRGYASSNSVSSEDELESPSSAASELSVSLNHPAPPSPVQELDDAEPVSSEMEQPGLEIPSYSTAEEPEDIPSTMPSTLPTPSQTSSTTSSQASPDARMSFAISETQGSERTSNFFDAFYRPTSSLVSDEYLRGTGLQSNMDMIDGDADDEREDDQVRRGPLVEVELPERIPVVETDHVEAHFNDAEPPFLMNGLAVASEVSASSSMAHDEDNLMRRSEYSQESDMESHVTDMSLTAPDEQDEPEETVIQVVQGDLSTTHSSVLISIIDDENMGYSQAESSFLEDVKAALPFYEEAEMSPPIITVRVGDTEDTDEDEDELNDTQMSSSRSSSPKTVDEEDDTDTASPADLPHAQDTNREDDTDAEIQEQGHTTPPTSVTESANASVNPSFDMLEYDMTLPTSATTDPSSDNSGKNLESNLIDEGLLWVESVKDEDMDILSPEIEFSEQDTDEEDAIASVPDTTSEKQFWAEDQVTQSGDLPRQVPSIEEAQHIEMALPVVQVQRPEIYMETNIAWSDARSASQPTALADHDTDEEPARRVTSTSEQVAEFTETSNEHDAEAWGPSSATVKRTRTLLNMFAKGGKTSNQLSKEAALSQELNEVDTLPVPPTHHHEPDINYALSPIFSLQDGYTGNDMLADNPATSPVDNMPSDTQDYLFQKSFAQIDDGMDTDVESANDSLQSPSPATKHGTDVVERVPSPVADIAVQEAEQAAPVSPLKEQGPTATHPLSPSFSLDGNAQGTLESPSPVPSFHLDEAVDEQDEDVESPLASPIVATGEFNMWPAVDANENQDVQEGVSELDEHAVLVKESVGQDEPVDMPVEKQNVDVNEVRDFQEDADLRVPVEQVLANETVVAPAENIDMAVSKDQPVVTEETVVQNGMEDWPMLVEPTVAENVQAERHDNDLSVHEHQNADVIAEIVPQDILDDVIVPEEQVVPPTVQDHSIDLAVEDSTVDVIEESVVQSDMVDWPLPEEPCMDEIVLSEPHDNHLSVHEHQIAESVAHSDMEEVVPLTVQDHSIDLVVEDSTVDVIEESVVQNDVVNWPLLEEPTMDENVLAEPHDNHLSVHERQIAESVAQASMDDVTELREEVVPLPVQDRSIDLAVEDATVDVTKESAVQTHIVDSTVPKELIVDAQELAQGDMLDSIFLETPFMDDVEEDLVEDDSMDLIVSDETVAETPSMDENENKVTADDVMDGAGEDQVQIVHEQENEEQVKDDVAETFQVSTIETDLLPLPAFERAVDEHTSPENIHEHQSDNSNVPVTVSVAVHNEIPSQPDQDIKEQKERQARPIRVGSKIPLPRRSIDMHTAPTLTLTVPTLPKQEEEDEEEHASSGANHTVEPKSPISSLVVEEPTVSSPPIPLEPNNEITVVDNDTEKTNEIIDTETSTSSPDPTTPATTASSGWGTRMRSYWWGSPKPNDSEPIQQQQQQEHQKQDQQPTPTDSTPSESPLPLTTPSLLKTLETTLTTSQTLRTKPPISTPSAESLIQTLRSHIQAIDKLMREDTEGLMELMEAKVRVRAELEELEDVLGL